MKIVKILGGLGNQMFQYALYLSLKHYFPQEDVKIDTSCFNGYPLHNGFELERVFGISAAEATFKDKFRLAYPYNHYRLWQIGKRILPCRSTMCVEKGNGEYVPSLLQVQGNVYYDGYWQDERYFEDIRSTILVAFTPKYVSERNRSVAKEAEHCISASIHIRRGDYIKNPVYDNICDKRYYINAIKKLNEELDIDCYYIFSNDMTWCKEHILPMLQGKRVVLVDWNKGLDSYQDIYLMSHCKHNIIANSSFSWWGAWLNTYTNKLVLCPQKWHNIPDSQFTLPKSWIQVTK